MKPSFCAYFFLMGGRGTDFTFATFQSNSELNWCNSLGWNKAAVCALLILLASDHVQDFREALHSCSVSGIGRTRAANAKRVQEVFRSTKELVLFWTVCGVLGELRKAIALGFFFCLIYLDYQKAHVVLPLWTKWQIIARIIT